ncbi:hypothetical protein CYPRO_0849 [Cyclonatronum proteinivorum]|uniref:Uncharacterized protein n=1 Tax=Cyclonatronum proteinivorum TaxID=1457365 RepID=A0A345UI24_9BACT|nr:hypothetical protein [Cyclonatronum proteinivorum]AXJ00126.1 hypothetical protein CYPRO_0849 [Cyclonatronum proteinivorum]
MKSTPIRFTITEDFWSPAFPFFLVDEGEIYLAFASEADALQYQQQSYLSHMLVADLALVESMMMEPELDRYWCGKMQRCVQPGVDSASAGSCV